MEKCKYEGTGIWNGRCVGTKEVDPCPGYDNCEQYKPYYISNADRIRAMSDEELAAKISRRCIRTLCDIVCGEDCKAFETLNKTSQQRYVEIVLDWLKQPSK